MRASTGSRSESNDEVTRRQIIVTGSSAICGLLFAACNEAANIAERKSSLEGAGGSSNPSPAIPKPSPTVPPGKQRKLVICDEVGLPCPGYSRPRVTIRFPDLSPAGRDAVNMHLRKFKYAAGIIAIAEYTNWRNTLKLLSTELAAGSAPDIWCGRELPLTEMANARLLLDIGEYINNWDDWFDFYPFARASAEYSPYKNKRSFFAFPYGTYFKGIPAIRASLFERAGLEPVPPTTWDELNEVTPKLTVKDGAVFEQVGINLEHDAQTYQDWLYQAGGKYFSDDDQLKPNNATPEGVEALEQHVRHGLLDGTMPPEGLGRASPSSSAFCSGRVAFQKLWPFELEFCESTAYDLFADTVVGAPLRGPKEQVMQVFVEKYFPSAQTDNPDAVFETMRYFASPEPNYEINMFDGRLMPCRNAMDGFPIFQREQYRSLLENFASDNDNGMVKLPQIVSGHSEVQSATSRWVQSAALGEYPVAESLQRMDAEVSGILGQR